MKDPYISKDGYHIQDLMDYGRCIICGRMAHQKHTKPDRFKTCDDEECQAQALQILFEKEN